MALNSLFPLVLVAYFALLWGISRLVARRHAENAAFFLGNRRSPWYVVAIGMVGSSISGVTLVSVPGMVARFDMTYLQMCLGFVVGYGVILFVLLPLYYRLELTSIYAYLERRFGPSAYRTGASFFLVSRTLLAATRLYVAIAILQAFVLDAWGVPFGVTAAGFLAMIWLYTRASGVRAIIWTDLVQTLLLVAAMVLIFGSVSRALGLDGASVLALLRQSPHARIFEFADWGSRQHFVKQFVSGIFVTIAMTGLDQEMMQKNLSCRSLRAAQKNVFSTSLAFLPINLLLLSLGVLLYRYAATAGLPIPARADDLLPLLVSHGHFGTGAMLLFLIGTIAATFASADAALTGLTTSVCVDLLAVSTRPEPEARRLRQRVHLAMAAAFLALILLFRSTVTTSAIDAIYTLVSYAYGPLLGLFAFGLATKRRPSGRWLPWVCLVAPALCYGLNRGLQSLAGYTMGYELLLVNAALVMVGLSLLPRERSPEGSIG